MSSHGYNPLAVPRERILQGTRIPAEIVPDPEAVTQRFAEDFIGEFCKARERDRSKIVFIVPVGPVGQFERIAARSNAERLLLRDLVVINMDEYLQPDGSDFIPKADPLSFRRHMDERFYGLLDPALAPPPDQRNPDRVIALIDKLGGTDACFGGVGITGHLAYNDPPSPGESMSADEFAALPTRVVRLSVETRVVNSITAAGGNIDRIPELAVSGSQCGAGRL